jgi:hypothetical protein
VHGMQGAVEAVAIMAPAAQHPLGRVLLVGPGGACALVRGLVVGERDGWANLESKSLTRTRSPTCTCAAGRTTSLEPAHNSASALRRAPHPRLRTRRPRPSPPPAWCQPTPAPNRTAPEGDLSPAGDQRHPVAVAQKRSAAARPEKGTRRQ